MSHIQVEAPNLLRQITKIKLSSAYIQTFPAKPKHKVENRHEGKVQGIRYMMMGKWSMWRDPCRTYYWLLGQDVSIVRGTTQLFTSFISSLKLCSIEKSWLNFRRGGFGLSRFETPSEKPLKGRIFHPMFIFPRTKMIRCQSEWECWKCSILVISTLVSSRNKWGQTQTAGKLWGRPKDWLRESRGTSRNGPGKGRCKMLDMKRGDAEQITRNSRVVEGPSTFDGPSGPVTGSWV